MPTHTQANRMSANQEEEEKRTTVMLETRVDMSTVIVTRARPQEWQMSFDLASPGELKVKLSFGGMYLRTVVHCFTRRRLPKIPVAEADRLLHICNQHLELVQAFTTRFPTPSPFCDTNYAYLVLSSIADTGACPYWNQLDEAGLLPMCIYAVMDFMGAAFKHHHLDQPGHVGEAESKMFASFCSSACELIEGKFEDTHLNPKCDFSRATRFAEYHMEYALNDATSVCSHRLKALWTWCRRQTRMEFVMDVEGPYRMEALWSAESDKKMTNMLELFLQLGQEKVHKATELFKAVIVVLKVITRTVDPAVIEKEKTTSKLLLEELDREIGPAFAQILEYLNLCVENAPDERAKRQGLVMQENALEVARVFFPTHAQ